MSVDIGPLIEPRTPWSRDGDDGAAIDATPAVGATAPETEPLSDDEFVTQLCAGMQTLFAAWHEAEEAYTSGFNASRSIDLAAGDLKAEGLPRQTDLQEIAGFIENKCKRRQRLIDARNAMPEKVATMRATIAKLAALLKGLVDLRATRMHEPLNVKDKPRVAAAVQMYDRLMYQVRNKETTIEEQAKKYEAAARYVETRSPAPPRAKYADQLKALGDAVTKLIEIHAKTLSAKHDAEVALNKLTELDKEEFTEPKRPTAEEVSRYIGSIEAWCRRQLPLLREAGHAIYVYRQHLTGLSVAIMAVPPCLRKVQYLDTLAVEPDVEALVLGAPELITVIKRHARELNAQGEEWRCRYLPNEEPQLKQEPEEEDVIEALFKHIKNVCIGVANKAIAKAKWQQIHKDRPHDPDKVPELVSCVEFDFANTYTRAHQFMEGNERARQALDAHLARVEEAYDAFKAREEMTRQASKQCAKTAGTLERTVKFTISDELRVFLAMTRKLEKLHNWAAKGS